MLRIRKLLLGVSLLVGMGSLSLSVAYGWYLHSDGYRQALEERVSAYLNLAMRIDRVQPLGFGSFSLDQVRALLPDRDERIFECRQAVWRRQQGGDGLRHSLELRGGRLTIGSESRAWRRPDYQRVLESGLAHDFADLNLKYVHLSDMDIHILRQKWSLHLGGANGEVVFGPQPGSARAHLESSVINGYRVSDPISMVVDFTPGKDLRIHEVRLDVPRIPIAQMNLDGLLQSAISKGWFRGRVTYREGDSSVVDLSGEAGGLSLAELTRSLPGGGLAGRLERVSIPAARIEDGRLTRIEFSGRLSDLQLADVAFLLDWPAIDGCLNLQIRHATITDDGIADLTTTGSIVDVDMALLTEALGVGEITGVLGVELRELTIVDDQLVSAEIDVVVQAPPDGSPTIDRQLIVEAARRFLGLELANLPFEELEYVKLGVRIVIDGSSMRLASPFDDPWRTILSVRLLGRELPVIRASDEVFELGDIIAVTIAKARQHDIARKLEERLARPPGNMPEDE